MDEWVLIETYWNVKFVDFKSSVCIIARINRNILECKVLFFLRAGSRFEVLIETYWNVKL